MRYFETVTAMAQVDQVLQKISEADCLNELTREELAVVPTKILLDYERELAYIWELLPETFTNMFEKEDFLPCKEHFNLPDWTCHVDSPFPLKKNCHVCQL